MTDEAEISMAMTFGLSDGENRVAEELAMALLNRGLTRRPVWAKSDSGIELQIPRVHSGNAIVTFTPQEFIESSQDELLVAIGKTLPVLP